MEKELSFTSEGLQLQGTLSLPDSSDILGAVLLIPGSGQIDRNENNRKFKSNIFNEISEELAVNYFASFRYDKRGVGESEGDYWKTGFYDHVTDASSATSFLKSLPQLQGKPLFILGHSEGAMISMRLAADEPGLAGAILLAGSAQNGEATLRWQAAEIAKGLTGFSALLVRLFHIDVLEAQAKALSKIKRSSKDWMRQNLFQKINAKWMREFIAYDPADDLKRIRIPVLAITGSKDIQVNPADLKRMAELIQGEYEYHEIPDMTHVLRADSGRPSMSTYKEQISRPVDPRLRGFIDTWLRKMVHERSTVSREPKPEMSRAV
jgi:pimeloyl-ACP methyl ester carboxylesterase